MIACSGVIDRAAAQQACPDETIYVAMLGTRKHRLSGENPVVGVFYTNDFGQTWQHTGWKQGKAFATFVPETSCGDTMWVAAGNGVMRSTDAGKSWRITTGWEVTEVQDVWVPTHDPTEVWAATPYGIYRSSDFGHSWNHHDTAFASSVRGGFIGTEQGLQDSYGSRAIEKPVRSIRSSPFDPEVWLVALEEGGIRVSHDGAQSFLPDATGGRTIYEAEFHPEDPAMIYAGGWDTGLLLSDDLGASWSEVEAFPARNVHGIAISRRNPSVIVVGSMDDGVFVTKNAGSTWEAAAPDIFEAGQIWDVHIPGE